ncbi:MAG: hypothetical protein M3Y81_03780 [Chloroflexota bacterium]|nr:hypothetical protein [Chloroflexota bacterium]
MEATPQRGLFARQPLSVFGKITLWTSVVRFLGGVAGLIPFILAATISSEILTITLCSLAVIVLLMAKLRWAPLVTIVLEVYIIYVTFTTPETLYNLSHPYAPSDGIALFITSVVAFTFSLLVLGGSIGATIENYRPTSRWLPAIFVSMIAGMIIGALFIGFIAQRA